MADSILTTTKKMLGIAEDYTSFDLDIIIHINSALATLTQLGVGPEDGFSIESSDETWSNFLSDDKKLSPVKTYVYLRVRTVFDPPQTSFALVAMKEQIKELEWRLNVTVETTVVLFDGGVV